MSIWTDTNGFYDIAYPKLLQKYIIAHQEFTKPLTLLVQMFSIA